MRAVGPAGQRRARRRQCLGRETAADWLARLGIAGRSGYLAYQRDSLPVIAVDRQVCCHHFRRRDGDYCSTCPKLDTTERIARLDAESAVAA